MPRFNQSEVITVEDLEDVSDTDSSFENSPAPLSKAANHRAFQNLIDENESLKRESMRKKEKLESAKNRLKVRHRARQEFIWAATSFWPLDFILHCLKFSRLYDSGA